MSDTTALTPYEAHEQEQPLQLTVVSPTPAPQFAWSSDDLAALKDTVAKDCNSAQFKVFIAAARRLGLDPFARQIVPIVQGGRMTPQTTIDGFRLIAERTKKYAGQIGPFWCGPDGEWREVWLEDAPPAAAKVGVIRRDFEQPVWGVARFKSYAKGGNWGTMPDVMIAKVAEALALRKGFPQELSGAYIAEEMGNETTSMSVVDADTTNAAQARQAVASQPRTAPKPTVKPASNGPWNPLGDREFRGLMSQLGYRSVDQVEGWLERDAHGLSRENAMAEARREIEGRTVDADGPDLHDLGTGAGRN